MFCSNCGKQIDEKAAICIHCGVATSNMQSKQEPQQIIVNNTASSSSSSSATIKVKGMRRHHSLGLDILLIFCTGGLWIIWMIVRPKYY